jgi:hypothetical protein
MLKKRGRPYSFTLDGDLPGRCRLVAVKQEIPFLSPLQLPVADTESEQNMGFNWWEFVLYLTR